MMRYARRFLLSCCLAAFLMNQIPVPADAQTPDIQIDVEQPGQKTASFSVGDGHRWFIRVDLPENWEKTDSFSVLQTLSPWLTLDTESVHVRLVRENGEQTLLRMGEHYQVTAGSVFVEQGVSDRFCVSLMPEGMSFLSAYRSADSQLMVVYTAKINTNAPMGTQIVGAAQLNLTDTEGHRTSFLSDKAAVAAGGFHIRLNSSAGDPLANERFMLAREADQEEQEDPAVLKEILDTGEETIVAVYEQFYTSGNMEGEKTDIAVTDASGQALCYGLAYGTYYLVQMESERSDILVSEPVQITVNEASHLTAADGWKDGRENPVDNTVCVTNTVLVMPQTGGIGTHPYTVSGTLVILCACILLWYNRKKTLPV